ncbi:MAG: hypothetical protein ACD_9C00239G0004 [uncultured bacterium]|nr:MAG: hypothetical protein ACD_9C00239G0004 [uncultured bacterium]
MSDFPSAITTPRIISNRPGVTFDPDDTKTFFAEDLNMVNDEIVAIETELGTDPAGAYATVKAWLTALTSSLSTKISTAKTVLIGSTLAVAIPAGTTRHVGSYLGGGAWEAGFVMPCAGTVRNLQIYLGSAPGSGQSYTCTMMKDNVAQSLAGTITGTGSNYAEDTTNSFTVAKGQRIWLRVVTSASAAPLGLQFCVELDTTT